jgi:carbonic anhydrase
MHTALGRPLTVKTLVWLTLLAAASSLARADEAPAHWSYSGATGPAHWAAEDPAYATCGVGRRQSPIDIRDATPAALPGIEFKYQPIPLVVTDTGHTMQVNVPPGSGGISVGDDHYDLVQFHFHRPSEERVRGQRYELVAHLVHKNDKGELAVVAVLLRRGKGNPVLKQVFDHFPASGQTQATVAGATLDLAQLLPQRRGYYTFEGSLTTPPCSEHVRWLVLKQPAEASVGQISQFAARYHNNARPIQPTNGRTLTQTQD